MKNKILEILNEVTEFWPLLLLFSLFAVSYIADGLTVTSLLLFGTFTGLSGYYIFKD